MFNKKKKDFFSYIMAKIRLATFQWDAVQMSPLYKPNRLSWIFIVLSNWGNSPKYVLLHSYTLSWFQTNQFCSYSLSCLLSRETLNAKFISLRLEPTRPWNEPIIYHTNRWQVYIHMATFFQMKIVNDIIKKLPVCSKMLFTWHKMMNIFNLVTDTKSNIDIICFWSKRLT